MLKKNLMSKLWTLAFCSYALWALNVGWTVFTDTKATYDTWVDEHGG